VPTILKAPRGLTSILALRSDGQVPHNLSDIVAGTVEMRELFLLDTRESIISNSNAAPAVGSNVYAGAAPGDLVIPAGELWYVWHYFCNSTLGAGAAIDFCPSAQLDATPLMSPLGPYVAGAATQNVKAPSISQFWAGPGTTFGFSVRSVTLAPSVNAGIVFTRLRV